MTATIQQINSVKKRNGSIVKFDESKIIAAIKKAFLASSPVPFSGQVKKNIVNRVFSLISADPDCNHEYVDIEVIQDIVQMALIMEGYRYIATEYMIYRDEKRKEREQKLLLLNKDSSIEIKELSEVEKRYSLQALKIFKERYLLKDNNGLTCERLDDLFKRVAVASGLMDILYHEEWYAKNGAFIELWGEDYLPPTFDDEMDFNFTDLQDIDYGKLGSHPLNLNVGKWIANPFHLERLQNRYKELWEEGQMGKSFNYILKCLATKEKYWRPIAKRIGEYYDLMANKVFLPNTPTLMNAGTKLGQLSACFTLAIGDSIEEIYDTKKDVALIFKSGGGIGINYKLRPRDSFIKSTGGKSPGAVHFLNSIDHDTGSISQGGKRRGAAMGIMNVNHPDILEFITAKTKAVDGPLSNHNISMNLTDDFFDKFYLNQNLDLVFDGKVYKKFNANEIMKIATQRAWETGDPGCVFESNMNSNNLLYPVFKKPIDVTNPCSEISMYPYESCNLASINMTKFVEDDKFDTKQFIYIVSIVTQFLDGVIDANNYPIEKIDKMSKSVRRIGVGMMGVGDMLTQLGIPYNHEQGFTMMEYLSALMTLEALNTSAHMAVVKGPFPIWENEKYPKDKLPVNALLKPKLLDDLMKRIPLIHDKLTVGIGIKPFLKDIPYQQGLRNCSVTTDAPTGTLSMFCDVTSSIEPIFSNGFTKKVTLGEFYYLNKNLEAALKRARIYSDELIRKIVVDNNGMLGAMDEIPDHIKKIFVTAMEIHHYDHIMAQSVCQRWITNGISKTINAANSITPQDIEYCYLLAWMWGNKGITVYRDGAKDQQVLNNASVDKNVRVHPYSSYTLEALNDLELPNMSYKNRLICPSGSRLSRLEPHLIQLCHTDGSVQNVVAPNSYASAVKFHLDHPEFTPANSMTCPGCGAINAMHRTSSHCQLCVNCGHKLGSCE